MVDRNSLFYCVAYGVILWFYSGCKDDTPVIHDQAVIDTVITVENEIADGEQPAVSPDGSKIAFVRNGDIWVMDTSGANQKQLTSGVEIDIAPRWKPDGSTIGFVKVANGEYNKGRIFTIQASGGTSVLLVQNHFVADSFVIASSGIEQPVWDWSYDGEKIAFLEQQGYITYLKVISINNELIFNDLTHNRLTAKDANRSCFIWSQTINDIAYIRQGATGVQEIVIKNLATGELLIDSTYQLANSLSRKPNTDEYAIIKSLGIIIVKDFKKNLTLEYEAFAGGGLKWSLDGENLLFHVLRTVHGPFGYTYSTLGIFNFKRNKQYTLTDKGDIGITNYFFDWSRKNNEVFFERYKKINKVSFAFTN